MAKNARRQISLFVDGNQVEATAKNIAAAYKKASNELANMVVGSDEYIAKLEEVQTLDGHLREHRDAIKGVESGLNLAKAGLDKFIGISAGAFAVDSILDYGQALFGTASNLDLMEKKARTVFGEALPGITAEAEKNAAAMGLTNREYVAAAAGIQDLLVPMGFQRKEAADISVQLQNLSGALAEWSNGQHDSKEVSEILSKSLLGERDALNSLGIDIKQAEVDAELYARGLDKLTGAAAKQAEATVTLDLILQKSADAQTAFAKGSDSMARRSAELTARLSEIRETLATALVPIFERLLALAGPVVDAFAHLASGIEGIVDPAHAAGKAFDTQASKVADLEKNISPLLSRYDELSGKATLSKKEQTELSAIIQKVSETVPLAVTQFDEYGKALGLNTDKAREFIATERARLQVINADAIDKYTESLKRETHELERLQNVVNTGKSVKEFGVFRQLSNEELQVAIKNLQEVQTRVTGINAEVARLKGENIKIPESKSADTGTPTPTGGGRTKEGEKAEEKQKQREKQLQEHLDRIQEIIQKNDDAIRVSTLSSDEQEIERIKIKYQNEIDQVKSKFSEEQQIKEAVVTLQDQRDAEIFAARQKQREEQTDAEIEAINEENARIDDAKRQHDEEQAKAQEELKKFNDEALFTDQQLEVQVLQDHYANLLKIAEQYGLDTTMLREAYAKKQAEIEKKYADKTAKEQQESLKVRLAAMKEAFSAFGDFTSALFDLLGSEAEDNAALQKVATLAKIAFDTAQAISSLMAASEANPTNSVTFGAAGAIQFVAGIARILSNVAQAKKILSSAPKVKAQQKAEGGFLESDTNQSTSSSRSTSSRYSSSTSHQALEAFGYTDSTNTSRRSASSTSRSRSSSQIVEVVGADDGLTYRAMQIMPPSTGMLPGFPVLFTSTATKAPVLASERGAEYFVASHDLSNPHVMHHVRMIENITRYGAVRQFAEGGFNAPAGSATTTAVSPPPVATPGVDVAALLAETNRALNNIAAVQAQLVALLSQGVTAVVPDRTITDIGKRFNVINEASGGFFT